MFPRSLRIAEITMNFDLSVFERRDVPLPDLFPVDNQASFLFSDNARLPDPMELVRLGALIVVNLSGGKDGQAMLLHMICRLQLPVSQMVCIHADLGEAEWERSEEHTSELQSLMRISYA